MFDPVSTIFCGAVVWCLGVCVSFIVVFGLGAAIEESGSAKMTKETVVSYDLIALKDDTYVSGIVNKRNKVEYIAVIKTEEGCKSITTNSDSTYIKETEGIPKLVKYVNKFENPVLNFLFITRTPTYKFFVPEKSIDMTYEIDLQ